MTIHGSRFGTQPVDVSLSLPTKDQNGRVVATISVIPGDAYPADSHRAGLLLVDPETSQALYLDYHASLSSQADAEGNLQAVTLTLPKGMKLPKQVRAYVLLDVYPVFEKDLLP